MKIGGHLLKYKKIKKSCERLKEESNMSRATLKIKKIHMQEYLKEIEKMRNRVVNLEAENESLRTNFERSIS